MAGKILIYDSIAANRIILRCKLSAACYDVVQASSRAELLSKLKTDAPDLVICDMDQSPAQAFELCRAVSSVADNAGVPILLAGTDPSPTLRIAAFKAGAWDVLGKPLHDDLLLASLRRCLRLAHSVAASHEHQAQAAALGFAEEDTGFKHLSPKSKIALTGRSLVLSETWQDGLRARLPDCVVTCLEDSEVLVQIRPDLVPDVFVILASAENWPQNLQLLSELRSRASTQHSKIVMVSLQDDTTGGHDDLRQPGKIAMALDLGADDVLHGDFHMAELALRLKTQATQKKITDDLRRALHNGMQLAARDPLTGLFNRRYAVPRARRMLHLAYQNNKPMAFMALDLDRFKTVNDTHGHPAGDAVLIEISRRLRDALRPRDMLARVGGEEFWIALPDTNAQTATKAAQALRQLVRENPIVLPDRRGLLRMTISIGVSVADPADISCVRDIDQLQESADSALYNAKANGRDKVTFASFAA